MKGIKVDKEKIKKVVISIVFILLAISFYFLGYQPKEEEKVKDKPVVTEVQETPETVEENKLNEIIMKNFLRELIGQDHSLFINLFNPQFLDKDITKMNEEELNRYTDKIVDSINENKELVQTRVLDVKNNDDTTEYKIQLEFRDGIKKDINLTIQNGKIITPIKELY